MKVQRKFWRITPWTLTNIILFVFLLGAIISPFASTCNSKGNFAAARGENPLADSEAVKQTEKIQKALQGVYRQVNPAVARIETTQTVEVPPFIRQFFRNMPGERKRRGLGSGFVISKDGYVVTNYHVVRPADSITIQLGNGDEYDAEIMGVDQASDLALLQAKNAEDLPVIHIGDSDKVNVGDFAIAIGNPFGLSSTFTFGVVSSISQNVQSQDGIPRIQTDAAINVGNSGGPLLNIKGEVIGINQMIVSRSGGYDGIGLAIPINYAMDVVQKLKKGEEIKHGYIGVVIDPKATEDDLRALNIDPDTPGLLIRSVQPGSPAYKAGVAQYDYITHVDGKKADSFSVLKSTIFQKDVGSSIDLRVLRKGEPKKVTVKIGERPDRVQRKRPRR